jgi:hypothetical protein
MADYQSHIWTRTQVLLLLTTDCKSATAGRIRERGAAGLSAERAGAEFSQEESQSRKAQLLGKARAGEEEVKAKAT